MNPTPIPRSALTLGLLGLLPFLIASATSVICALTEPDPVMPTETALTALGAYGAVILSFLGGVRWGNLLADEARIERWVPLTLSVIPSLIAWPALLLPPDVMLCVLAAGFGYQFIRDRNAVERGELPGWYGRLRFLLTSGAVLSLLTPVLVTTGR